MTIKLAIELEAVKAAALVRKALNDFASATGMQPEMTITWVRLQLVDEAASTPIVADIKIEVGGLSIEA